MTSVPALSSVPTLSPTTRVRRTPFSDRVEACGVTAYTVYNHMLLATVFRSVEEDYQHLCQAVQIWDVSCERQVEIKGPDAARLTQLMTCRDLSKAKYGQCFYAPLVDEDGGMVNDPIILKLDEDRFWLSIADSDVMLWAKGLARGYSLDVKVFEADVYPLAVQGPKAEEVMATVFGDEVRDIRFFRFKKMAFEGHEMVVARSGWSKQGGFEIYLDRKELALELWDQIWAAGQAFDIRAGCPNAIERVEGSLLSYGNDMTMGTSPFDCGLGKYVNLEADIDFVARDALQRKIDQGLQRTICHLLFSEKLNTGVFENWSVFDKAEQQIGKLTSGCDSIRHGAFLAIATIAKEYLQNNETVFVQTPFGSREARIASFPME
ncbi:dimethylsulfoniopropionate demethylase [Kiloniella litopenaei]|uniref:dimethylsulfoniopropionate demethylase n=1 Tax=Kiloniella litopenaei TaxID=1549748 RepID=UPI003BAD0F44